MYDDEAPDTASSVLDEDLPASGTAVVEWAHAGHISWQVEGAVVGSESLPNDGSSQARSHFALDLALREARKQARTVHSIAALEELLHQDSGTAEDARLAVQVRSAGLEGQLIDHYYAGAAIVP